MKPRDSTATTTSTRACWYFFASWSTTYENAGGSFNSVVMSLKRTPSVGKSLMSRILLFRVSRSIEMPLPGVVSGTSYSEQAAVTSLYRMRGSGCGVRGWLGVRGLDRQTPRGSPGISRAEGFKQVGKLGEMTQGGIRRQRRGVRVAIRNIVEGSHAYPFGSPHVGLGIVANMNRVTGLTARARECLSKNFWVRFSISQLV